MAKSRDRTRRRSPLPPGRVRIIGGRWRGRRLPVGGGPALRPTPDRVRETLFNWLAPWLPGARCLDLFAGTGVLGLEALSREAAEAWLVERDGDALANLRASVAHLDAGARIVEADAFELLATWPPEPFDIVFLDPPFQGTDYGGLCTLLAAGWLKDEAFIYLERDRRTPLPALPAGWSIHREAAAGDVQYTLFRRRGTA